MLAFVFHVNHCSVSLSKLIIYRNHYTFAIRKTAQSAAMFSNRAVRNKKLGAPDEQGRKWKMWRIGLFINTSSREKKQTVRSVLLPLVHVYHSVLSVFPSVACARYLLRTLPAL